jgi:hypothetical protein
VLTLLLRAKEDVGISDDRTGEQYGDSHTKMHYYRQMYKNRDELRGNQWLKNHPTRSLFQVWLPSNLILYARLPASQPTVKMTKRYDKMVKR